MQERSWTEVVQQFTANGSTNGIVSVASTKGFYSKQIVSINSLTKQPISLQVKRVLSKTTLIVGPKSSSMNDRADISEYLLNDNAWILSQEQTRPNIPQIDYERACYQEEPVVAKRSILVDDLGNTYNDSNPMPVNLTGESITVKLDPFPGPSIESRQPSTIINGNETQIAEFTALFNQSYIKKIYSHAMTYGLFRVYKNTIDVANILEMFHTSPTDRQCNLILETPILLNTSDKLIITFEADRYNTTLLGASSTTFTKLEGFRII